MIFRFPLLSTAQEINNIKHKYSFIRKSGFKHFYKKSEFCMCAFAFEATRLENFSKPLEMMQCQEHKPFAGTKCFLKAEPLLKMRSAADDHQQHGHVTTQHEYENLFDPIED
jgi:hypothetical protein